MLLHCEIMRHKALLDYEMSFFSIHYYCYPVNFVFNKCKYMYLLYYTQFYIRTKWNRFTTERGHRSPYIIVCVYLGEGLLLLLLLILCILKYFYVDGRTYCLYNSCSILWGTRRKSIMWIVFKINKQCFLFFLFIYYCSIIIYQYIIMILYRVQTIEHRQKKKYANIQYWNCFYFLKVCE